jgi:hypothetical protein
MMFSSNAYRFVLVLAAACNTVTSATEGVDLKTAESYTILAKTGISTVPNSVITGDIAVSPIASAAMTGFSFTMDSDREFSTSSQIHATQGTPGRAFASDYAGDVPTQLTQAVLDMEAAYSDAAGRLNTDAARKDLGAGSLGDVFGGPTAKLTPGVYTFATDVNIASTIYFDGSATDVFIIQIQGNLIQTANTKVILSNGALAENIFWQVGGHVQVGAGAHLEGILLAKTAVTFITGSSLNGRILAQTAVALQMATITQPPVEVLRRSLLRKGVLRE